MASSTITALRGTLVTFTGDPFLVDPASAFVHEPDGLVVCRDGLIEAVGAYDSVRSTLRQDVPVTDYSGCIISAGFIDTHTHYVQTEIIAAPGKQLLQWVTDYVYPVEEAFADEAHAREVAAVFCDALLRNGTTNLRLLRRLSAIGGRAVCRSGATPHANDRRQVHDGPQRAGGFARYAPIRIRPIEGAHRQMA